MALFRDGTDVYGNVVAELHNHCKHSIVFLSRRHKDSHALTYIGTGIIIASGNDFCYIATAATVKKKDHVCNIMFSDGTVITVDAFIFNMQKNVRMATLLLYGVSKVHRKDAVTFSDNEIAMHQTVFTCGFNAGTKERSFTSGSLVSCVDIHNDDAPDARCFSHSCAVDRYGHYGSAVFNENHHLVGMNIIHVIDKDHEQDKIVQHDGGMVISLDLHSIKLGLEFIYPQMKGKTIQEIIQYIRAIGEAGSSSS